MVFPTLNAGYTVHVLNSRSDWFIKSSAHIVIGWSNFIVVQLNILFLKTKHSKGSIKFYFINV